MNKRHTRLLWIAGGYLAAAAALLGWALLVEDHMGMGYLMGLYTVCLFNAACLFGANRTGARTALAQA